jgi:hypothetical protein
VVSVRLKTAKWNLALGQLGRPSFLDYEVQKTEENQRREELLRLPELLISENLRVNSRVKK